MIPFREKLGYIVFTALPICLLVKLIQYGMYSKKVMAQQLRDHKKHNCVVTYSKDSGMAGWPEYPERLKLTLNNVQKFKEPIIYFIDTAKHRIDICVMILYCPDIINALERAIVRGVKIRLILDPRYDNNSNQIRELVRKGLQILFDVKVLNVESMMHNKYAVKDFNYEDHTGYSLCGSMNWTQTAFTDNYEFLVFSTNRQLVGSFNKNFKEMWEYLTKMRESVQITENIYTL